MGEAPDMHGSITGNNIRTPGNAFPGPRDMKLPYKEGMEEGMRAVALGERNTVWEFPLRQLT